VINDKSDNAETRALTGDVGGERRVKVSSSATTTTEIAVVVVAAVVVVVVIGGEMSTSAACCFASFRFCSSITNKKPTHKPPENPGNLPPPRKKTS